MSVMTLIIHFLGAVSATTCINQIPVIFKLMLVMILCSTNCSLILVLRLLNLSFFIIIAYFMSSFLSLSIYHIIDRSN